SRQRAGTPRRHDRHGLGSPPHPDQRARRRHCRSGDRHRAAGARRRRPRLDLLERPHRRPGRSGDRRAPRGAAAGAADRRSPRGTRSRGRRRRRRHGGAGAVSRAGVSRPGAPMTTVASPPARRPSSSLSARIVRGVLAGIATGVIFGEYAAVLQVVADGYVRLLQMTVLPYVTISIVSGLGALDFAEAKRLGARVGTVLGLLWATALLSVLLVALMFPPHESASFFSTTLLQEREGFDFLGLYIPTNPFNSLANNIVPSVVLFSIVVGLALIPVQQKGRLIEVLSIANAAISNATNFIVSLTPYGVFAISAVVAGTLGFETLARLQVYLISYVSIALLLSLWVLPGLVATLTPVPFRAV